VNGETGIDELQWKLVAMDEQAKVEKNKIRMT